MRQIISPDELHVGRLYWIRDRAGIESDGIAEIEMHDGKQMHVEHPFFSILPVATAEDRGWVDWQFFGPIPLPTFVPDITVSKSVLKRLEAQTTGDAKSKETDQLATLLAMQHAALTGIMSSSKADPNIHRGPEGKWTTMNVRADRVAACEQAIAASSATADAWLKAHDEQVKREFATWLCTQTCVQTAAMQYVSPPSDGEK